MAMKEREMGSTTPDQRRFVACDQCGTPFEHDVSYSVDTRVDSEGTLRLYSFCDEACQEAWDAEH